MIFGNSSFGSKPLGGTGSSTVAGPAARLTQLGIEQVRQGTAPVRASQFSVEQVRQGTAPVRGSMVAVEVIFPQFVEPPLVTTANALATGNTGRVDIILSDPDPEQDHTLSRYRILRTDNDEVVWPADGTYEESAVDLLGLTATGVPIGVELVAQALWDDAGFLSDWGTSEPFSITTRTSRNRFPGITVFKEEGPGSGAAGPPVP